MRGGPPPPLGFPWQVDVGRNPNINRDPPPPPLDGAPIPIAIHGPAPIGVVVNGPGPERVIIANEVAPPPAMQFGPPPPVMHVGPPPPYAPMSMGPPPMPPVAPNLPGLHRWEPGVPNFPPPPMPGAGISALNGYQMGMGGMGMGMGGFGGFPPPFAPGGLPWAGNGLVGPMGVGMGMGGIGMGMGGMGMGGMGGMGMGMGMGPFMGGFGPFGWQRPPPPVIDGGVGPPGGAQTDPTVKPGGELPGHTVVQPAETTSIFRILSNYLPWDLPPGMPLTTEPMQFDSGWTINRLIAGMRAPEKDHQGWAVTECLEIGSGRWAKGIGFHYGSQQATEQTMGMVGWGSNRNRNKESPLYLIVHRI